MHLTFRLWPRGSRPRFTPPLPGVRAETVSLEGVFQRSGSVRYVDPDSADAAIEVAAAKPGILAGGLRALLDLAPGVIPNGPTHAVVVLMREGEACLSDQQRDDLWDAYQVPVFEQVITASGELVAWECEAHEGLHLAGNAEAPARSRLETSICDCGATSPRVMAASVAPRANAGAGGSPLILPGRLASSRRPIAT